MFVLWYTLVTFKDGDTLEKNNCFTNKIHKCYDIENYIIDNDFIFEKSNIFFEDSNTIIYDIGNDLAFKINKSLFNKERESYTNEETISSLVLKQKNITLTDFPIGVVSCKKRCVGQVIRLYKNYYPLKGIVNNDNISILYDKVIAIIEELLNNGIMYSDIHENNFLVNNNLDVKLIDFESSCVSFNNISPNDKIFCYSKIKSMFDRLNTLNEGNYYGK